MNNGLYIFGGLIVVGIVAFIVFKVKWGRADKTAERTRAGKIGDRIEGERIKEEGKIKKKTQV